MTGETEGCPYSKSVDHGLELMVDSLSADDLGNILVGISNQS